MHAYQCLPVILVSQGWHWVRSKCYRGRGVRRWGCHCQWSYCQNGHRWHFQEPRTGPASCSPSQRPTLAQWKECERISKSTWGPEGRQLQGKSCANSIHNLEGQWLTWFQENFHSVASRIVKFQYSRDSSVDFDIPLELVLNPVPNALLQTLPITLV